MGCTGQNGIICDSSISRKCLKAYAHSLTSNYVNRLSTFYFFRYNPNNLTSLETYVDVQAKENAYDLEANLVVLKQYQFNQNHDIKVISQILLKALTNFPHTDFILCKCLLNEQLVSI